jgi:hypothetical protein
MFVPKDGVKIETDPKATAAASMGTDDEAIIEELLAKLEVVTGEYCSPRHPPHCVLVLATSSTA